MVGAKMPERPPLAEHTSNGPLSTTISQQSNQVHLYDLVNFEESFSSIDSPPQAHSNPAVNQLRLGKRVILYIRNSSCVHALVMQPFFIGDESLSSTGSFPLAQSNPTVNQSELGKTDCNVYVHIPFWYTS